MKLLIAVVEIEGRTGVIVLFVLATVFVLIAILGWMIVRSATVSRSKDSSTSRFSTNIPLPVSPTTFAKLARVGTKAISRPSLTPEQQHFVRRLPSARKTLASGVRLGLIIAGLAGIGLALAIYRDYQDDEMILLPVGIIVLLSLGALMSGIVPSRTVDPIEPIDPELLRNVHVNVDVPSLTVQLDEATARQAMGLLEQGLSPESVARQVTVGYDRLSEAERDQVRAAIDVLRSR